jgi:hypothetical protein
MRLFQNPVIQHAHCINRFMCLDFTGLYGGGGGVKETTIAAIYTNQLKRRRTTSFLGLARRRGACGEWDIQILYHGTTEKVKNFFSRDCGKVKKDCSGGSGEACPALTGRLRSAGGAVIKAAVREAGPGNSSPYSFLKIL